VGEGLGSAGEAEWVRLTGGVREGVRGVAEPPLLCVPLGEAVAVGVPVRVKARDTVVVKCSGEEEGAEGVAVLPPSPGSKGVAVFTGVGRAGRVGEGLGVRLPGRVSLVRGEAVGGGVCVPGAACVGVPKPSAAPVAVAARRVVGVGVEEGSHTVTLAVEEGEPVGASVSERCGVRVARGERDTVGLPEGVLETVGERVMRVEREEVMERVGVEAEVAVAGKLPRELLVAAGEAVAREVCVGARGVEDRERVADPVLEEEVVALGVLRDAEVEGEGVGAEVGVGGMAVFDTLGLGLRDGLGETEGDLDSLGLADGEGESEGLLTVQVGEELGVRVGGGEVEGALFVAVGVGEEVESPMSEGVGEAVGEEGGLEVPEADEEAVGVPEMVPPDAAFALRVAPAAFAEGVAVREAPGGLTVAPLDVDGEDEVVTVPEEDPVEDAAGVELPLALAERETEGEGVGRIVPLGDEDWVLSGGVGVGVGVGVASLGEEEVEGQSVGERVRSALCEGRGEKETVTRVLEERVGTRLALGAGLPVPPPSTTSPEVMDSEGVEEGVWPCDLEGMGEREAVELAKAEGVGVRLLSGEAEEVGQKDCWALEEAVAVPGPLLEVPSAGVGLGKAGVAVAASSREGDAVPLLLAALAVGVAKEDAVGMEEEVVLLVPPPAGEAVLAKTDAEGLALLLVAALGLKRVVGRAAVEGEARLLRVIKAEGLTRKGDLVTSALGVALKGGEGEVESLPISAGEAVGGCGVCVAACIGEGVGESVEMPDPVGAAAVGEPEPTAVTFIVREGGGEAVSVLASPKDALGESVSRALGAEDAVAQSVCTCVGVEEAHFVLPGVAEGGVEWEGLATPLPLRFSVLVPLEVGLCTEEVGWGVVEGVMRQGETVGKNGVKVDALKGEALGVPLPQAASPTAVLEGARAVRVAPEPNEGVGLGVGVRVGMGEDENACGVSLATAEPVGGAIVGERDPEVVGDAKGLSEEGFEGEAVAEMQRLRALLRVALGSVREGVAESVIVGVILEHRVLEARGVALGVEVALAAGVRVALEEGEGVPLPPSLRAAVTVCVAVEQGVAETVGEARVEGEASLTVTVVVGVKDGDAEVEAEREGSPTLKDTVGLVVWEVVRVRKAVRECVEDPVRVCDLGAEREGEGEEDRVGLGEPESAGEGVKVREGEAEEEKEGDAVSILVRDAVPVSVAVAVVEGEAVKVVGGVVGMGVHVALGEGVGEEDTLGVGE
jgi:hypothetical protein